MQKVAQNSNTSVGRLGSSAEGAFSLVYSESVGHGWCGGKRNGPGGAIIGIVCYQGHRIVTYSAYIFLRSSA